ncbi:hypothetical protein VYU27_006817 [Nannochloropsis oceanica]
MAISSINRQPATGASCNSTSGKTRSTRRSLPLLLLCFLAFLGPAPASAFLRGLSPNSKSNSVSRRCLAARRVVMSGSSSSSNSRPHVVVGGAGFGGLYSALRLAELSRTSHGPPSIDITLVDRHDRFVFLPLLYELAVGDAGLEEVAPSFKALLASTGIRFVQGEIENVDIKGKTVMLMAAAEVDEEGMEGGKERSVSTDAAIEDVEQQQEAVIAPRTLSYDKLVLALGSEPILPPPSSSSDQLHQVMPFYRLEDAQALRERLSLLNLDTTFSSPPPSSSSSSSPSLFRVVIVGGGYSGVELAANLAARLGRDRGKVTLIDRGYQILGGSPAQVRANAGKKLEEEGVEVMLGVDVLKVSKERVVVKDRARASAAGARAANGMEGGEGEGKEEGEDEATIILAADLVVWTAGAKVSRVIQSIEGLDKDARGKIITDQGLRAGGSNGDIYVLGDSAAVRGYRGGGPAGSEGEGEKVLPSTAQVAFQESEVVAWNVWSSVTPSAPGPLVFQYTPLGEMLTLGPLDGAISSLQGMINLEGPTASLARRLVYVMRMPTGPQRLKAAKGWVKGRTEKLKGAVRGVAAGKAEQ